jgi:hypothetical protein
MTIYNEELLDGATRGLGWMNSSAILSNLKDDESPFQPPRTPVLMSMCKKGLIPYRTSGAKGRSVADIPYYWVCKHEENLSEHLNLKVKSSRNPALRADQDRFKRLEDRVERLEELQLGKSMNEGATLPFAIDIPPGRPGHWPEKSGEKR